MNAFELIRTIERIAPPSIQASWDNSGMQVAGASETVSRVRVTIDPTPEAIERCLEDGADFILTHHPLYLKPMGLGKKGPFLDTVRRLMSSGAWLYSAHTSLDAAPEGPAFWLGRELGLKDTKVLEPTAESSPVKVSFHVDKPLERETAEIWAEREGMLSISQDRNQFVRIVCEPDKWPSIADAVVFHLGARPEFFIKQYEAPVTKVGIGEVGDLPEPVSGAAFIEKIKQLAGRTTVTLSGPIPDTVAKAAYCPGSGGSLIKTAFGRGADAFITGDVKYHDAVEAPGLVIDVGHFSLEEEMTRRFCAELAESLHGKDADIAFVPGRDPYAFV